MTPSLEETVVAVGSAAGSGPRSLVRIGGPDALEIVDRLTRNSYASDSRPRRESVTLDLLGVPLPCEVQRWPGSRSFIGQPMAELHLVGAPPLVEEVFSRLCTLGARPAGRGEFTLRAFLAGRLDLVQAEAVLGVIDADDQHELARALTQLDGGISGGMHDVRSNLLNLLADLEAGLDFVDEDIEFVAAGEVSRRLSEAKASVADLLGRTSGRLRSTGRRRVVLAGPSNAGKSTLFNRLAGARSLVSPIAGTTRDYLVADVDFGGIVAELVDTAGREADPRGILAQADDSGRDQTERADLVVWCLPADAPSEMTATTSQGTNCLVLGTKADLGGPPVAVDLAIDARNGDLSPLRTAILDRLTRDTTDAGEILATTSARCRQSLAMARDELARAREACEAALGDELVALELRAALDHLGEVVGAVYTDDVLDRVFSRFCIGK